MLIVSRRRAGVDPHSDGKDRDQHSHPGHYNCSDHACPPRQFRTKHESNQIAVTIEPQFRHISKHGLRRRGYICRTARLANALSEQGGRESAGRGGNLGRACGKALGGAKAGPVDATDGTDQGDARRETQHRAPRGCLRKRGAENVAPCRDKRERIRGSGMGSAPQSVRRRRPSSKSPLGPLDPPGAALSGCPFPVGSFLCDDR